MTRVANEEVSKVSERALYTVKQFSEKHPAFSEGALRSLIFLASERHTSRGVIAGNGLSRAIIRIGRKLLIDEAAFFTWIIEQQKL